MTLTLNAATGTRKHRSLLGVATAMALLSASRLSAIDLTRGDPLPRLDASTTQAGRIDTNELRGRVVLLLFGETKHDRTQLARIHLDAALDDPRLAGVDVQPVLVLSKRSDVDDLEWRPTDGVNRLLIVHDTQREVFGTFKVVAIPSVVVADRAGVVVHAAAGLTTDRFGDVVLDALLVASGRMGVDRLESTIAGSTPPGSAEAHLRARQLARVARRLVQAQMGAMAEERYLEAVDLAPDLVELRVELGYMLVQQHRLDEAEQQFMRALETTPNALDASCGIALVLVSRDEPGDVLRSRAILETVLAQYPTSARAHYVLGLVHERQGDPGAAAKSFRRAAEILLETTTHATGVEDGP